MAKINNPFIVKVGGKPEENNCAVGWITTEDDEFGRQKIYFWSDPSHVNGRRVVMSQTEEGIISISEI